MSAQILRSLAGLMLLLALLVVAACGAPQEDAAPAEEEAAAGAEAAELLSEQGQALVERAAKIAKSLKEDPQRAAEILEANDLDLQKWEELMRDIAQDPALSAAYQAAMSG